MDQLLSVKFSEFILNATGLKNYALGYLALKSISDANASSVFGNILKYIKANKESIFLYDVKDGRLIDSIKDFEIPYPIYEYFYLLTDSYVRDFIYDYCKPLEPFQNVFAQFQTDFIDGKCNVEIRSFGDSISSVCFMYDKRFLTSIQPGKL